MFRADHHGPDVLAGVFRWSAATDVIVLTGAEHAHAYRMPAGPGLDEFAPRAVFWWYRASPVWTLRALLTLPAPGLPGAPATLGPAPPGAGVPGARVPVRVRRRGR
jgi:hypothetical protein